MIIFFSINTLMFLMLLWLRSSVPVSTQVWSALAFGVLMCGYALLSTTSVFREMLRFRSSDPVGSSFKFLLSFVGSAFVVGWVVLCFAGVTVGLGWLLFFSFAVAIVSSFASR